MAAKLRRMISPKTLDYIVESGGLKGDDSIATKALLALKTRRGSCAVLSDFGSLLHEVKTADEAGARQAQGLAVNALSHLESEVEELTVTAEAILLRGIPTGAIELEVRWRKGKVEDTLSYRHTVGG